MALYTATVTNWTRGWSYTAVEGDPWDPADDVVLTAPLQVTWGWIDEVIPSQLEPMSAKVELAGRTADDLPIVEVGDYVSLDIRVGTAGARILDRLFRVATVDAQLGGAAQYRSTMSLDLSDLSVDWNSVEPGLVYDAWQSGGDADNVARDWWRERLAEIAVRTGISVGAPTWWTDTEAPDISPSTSTTHGTTAVWGAFDGNMLKNLTELINSHQPGDNGGYTHTWVGVYAPSGFPSGYRRVGPDTWSPDKIRIPTALTEPNTALRVLAVPASRKLNVSAGLPFVFGVVDGVVTLVPVNPPAGYMTQLGLSADWCTVPAKIHRTRSDGINYVTLKGSYRDANGKPVDIDGTVQDAGDVAARGVNKREIPTQLTIWPTTGLSLGQIPEVARVAANFLTFATIGSGWAFDGVTLYSSRIPAATAAWLLTRLLPRPPGETDGDGILVRHITVFGIDEALRFAGAPVTAFITGGSLTLTGSDMVWTLETTPGSPTWVGGTAAAPVTVGDVTGAAYGTSTVAAVDPVISLQDLDYVDA